jgi:hypothetical protein
MTSFRKKLTNISLIISICVIVFVFFCFMRFDSESKRAMSEAIDFVPSVRPIYDSPCDYPQPLLREINSEEAVYLAECFVIQNGYTDRPPIADKSKLTPENLFALTDEDAMKMRHDSLERNAYSYERSQGYGGSWEVMFKFRPHPDVVKFWGEGFDHIGRAVVMDFYGRELRILHSQQPIGMPEAVIIQREK